MNSFRRLSFAFVLVLILAAAAGSASAHSPAPPLTHTTQVGRTPEQLCADAVPAEEPETREFEQAEDVLQAGVDYWAVFCTEAGPVYVDLYESESPVTVNNFVFLAQQHYFNNTTFHRVLPGFMAQGGDPTGTGSGGPGYMFEDETDNGLIFDHAGLLAMANSGENTNGSQFFITYAETPWLDGLHTIFGSVYQGLNEAELLMPRDPEQMPDYEGAALNTVVIVEDPASVDAAQDEPPSIGHFQALLEQAVATQLNTLFVMDEDVSHAYDLDAQAESWADLGGEALVETMRGTLAEHGFAGAALIWLKVSECPPTPESLPIWAVGFGVAEYGADGAQAVVADDTRASALVDAGAYDATSDAPDVNGRVFSRAVPAESWCGANGVFYRLEVPYGRYVVTVDLVVDGDYIHAESDPTATQYLGYIFQDLLYNSLGGTLNRGNGPAAE